MKACILDLAMNFAAFTVGAATIWGQIKSVAQQCLFLCVWIQGILFSPQQFAWLFYFAATKHSAVCFFFFGREKSAPVLLMASAMEARPPPPSLHLLLRHFDGLPFLRRCVCRASLPSFSSAVSACCHPTRCGAPWPRPSRTNSASSWASWMTLQSAL